MNETARPRLQNRRIAAVIVGAAFLWALTLCASPQLHERFHPDAGGLDHRCAITLINAGSCHHGNPGPPVTPAISVRSVERVEALSPAWVASLFLAGSIFEHAPPELS